MKKRNNLVLIITTLICLLPIVVGIIFYNQIPDRVATHFNFAGEPDGYSSKLFGIIILPLILVLVNVSIPLIIKMDPKYDNIQNKTINLIQWIIPVVCLFASGTTLSYALGTKVDVTLMSKLFVGILFTVIGNYLPKMSQSYTVGIKLPWTLASEENWNKTHRFAGFVWVVCGMLFLLTTLINVNFRFFIVFFVAMVLLPTVYSYVYYLKSKN